MSSLLYRLGRWCAAHAWRTLTVWLVLLVGLGVLAGTLGKPLTSQISIPGTTFQKVIDRLGTEIPEAAGGAGTVVLQSTGGTPMTPEQRAAAEQVFATWAQVPHVKRVNDPFQAQAQLDRSATDLAAAATTLEAGQQQTIAANIAAQFPEANPLGVSALIATGLGGTHRRAYTPSFAGAGASTRGRNGEDAELPSFLQ